ncbi:M64 family metallopeptidase [Actinomadura sp. DC4]|uniref:M64 family metallopeptidase n=1 Tax=Actinomadura sp. DC4 TaxID=3055069 RepID=UPI0025B0256A|nr:M64 family metallopeptidase [Actinomadura sp. DC4]MDN3351114.1 M64 family metallopeptidase [Actinomadura sp. DC4]
MRTAAAVAVFSALPLPAAPARSAEAARVVPLQVTGDPANRFNLILLGDGYTAADLPGFRQDVARQLGMLFAFEPWKSYRSYLNVYRVEIASPESGVSCDPGPDAPVRRTPLGMAFWNGCHRDDMQRRLAVNARAAEAYADLVRGTGVANRQIVALAHSTTYGGTGGTYATASGGNTMSALIMPHELGHTLGGLQDEYDYYRRGEPGGAYTGGEPRSVQHTVLTAREMRARRLKWWRWLGAPSASGGVIGRYEGGMYARTGVWRPSEHSMMKTLGYAYDQVARERMTQAIAAKVDLIQAATPSAAPIGADRVVWLETLHPVGHLLRVTWRLDGRVVRSGRHDLDLARLRPAPGRHTLTAEVTDPTRFVRDPAIRASPALTRTRTWTVDTGIRTPAAAIPVAFTAATPEHTDVGADDVIYAETTHPVRSAPAVRWTLDGRRVTTGGPDRDLRLARFHLRSGTHRVTARTGDRTLAWTVDAQRPRTRVELSRPASVTGGAYVFDGRFTMRLEPRDSGGPAVAEFQVDGDGWFRYFGWPDDPKGPFVFTPLGTEIDHLVYGRLGRPARTSPWDVVPPGHGRHTIEYRSVDAAGNVGAARRLTVVLRP